MDAHSDSDQKTLNEACQPAGKEYPPNSSPVGKEMLLPLEQMDEYDFERLCARLAARETDLEGARRYGTRGQDQYGIDIYGRIRGTKHYRVFQCKRYQNIQPAKIKEILETFLDGQTKAAEQEIAGQGSAGWLQQTQHFTLCITVALEKGKFDDTIQTIAQTRSDLTFDRWDLVQITELLKNHPDIVEEFFGRPAAEKLCNTSSLLQLEVEHFKRKSKASDILLLQAKLRAVEFAGRDEILEDLRQWCLDGEDYSVDTRLVFGDGGVGKTRLALELALEFRNRRGWIAGFIRRDNPHVAQAAYWEQVLRRNQDALIVADYAENLFFSSSQFPKPPLLALREALAKSNKKVRLLLLSREAGNWYSEFNKGNPYTTPGDKPDHLEAPKTLEPTQRLAEFERARSAFAAKLSIEKLPAGPLPDLSDGDFARVLFVHMLALLACYEAPLPHPSATQVWMRCSGANVTFSGNRS